MALITPIIPIIPIIPITPINTQKMPTANHQADVDCSPLPPTINIRGRLLDFERPWVMGIVNVTPDSFYEGSRTFDPRSIADRVARMRDEGADCIDLGAYSTRPGAPEVSEEEEWDRLARGLEETRRAWPEAVVSVDTFRASVARKAVEQFQADIINDVSGGTLDPEMFATVAELKAAYVLMHMRGTPADMQNLTNYDDVTADVLKDLLFKAAELRRLGVCDIILDPGFGFSKTVDQNYRLLDGLEEFTRTGMPVLAGMSRKSMIWRPLGITPTESLPGTVALHMAAMMKGASIIRVHDVAPARQSAEVFALLKRNRQAPQPAIFNYSPRL